jgi:hypothetical protein
MEMVGVFGLDVSVMVEQKAKVDPRLHEEPGYTSLGLSRRLQQWLSI